MPVDIGKLNKRITFQIYQDAKDELGQDCKRYEDYKTVWATIKPTKATEANFIGKLKPEVTHRIYVRYRDDITADMRIVYHGRLLYLAGPPIDVDEKHELLEIQAEERKEDGEY